MFSTVPYPWKDPDTVIVILILFYWVAFHFIFCFSVIFIPSVIFISLSLEKEMAAHSSILAWRVLWTEEPGGLLSIGSHRVRHDWSDLACIIPTMMAGIFFFFLKTFSCSSFLPKYIKWYWNLKFLLSINS